MCFSSVYPNEILPPIGVGYFGCAYWLASLSTVELLPYMINAAGNEFTLAIFPAVSIFLIFYLTIKMKDTSGKRKDQIEKMFRLVKSSSKDKGKEQYGLFSNKIDIPI